MRRMLVNFFIFIDLTKFGNHIKVTVLKVFLAAHTQLTRKQHEYLLLVFVEEPVELALTRHWSVKVNSTGFYYTNTIFYTGLFIKTFSKSSFEITVS